MRRNCSRCRLDQCFAMGMKHDLFCSKEKMQRRKQRLEHNRTITTKHSSSTSKSVFTNSETISQTYSNEIDDLLMETNNDDNTVLFQQNILMKTLSVTECVTIESVRLSFSSMFQVDTASCARIDVSNRASALISWSYLIHEIALCFINFFRQTNEFKCLNDDDRFILIKFNIFPLFILSKCFNYKPFNDCCSRQNCKEVEKLRRFFMLCGAENDFRDVFASLIRSLIDVTEQDLVLISILSIILIYSHGSLFDDNEPLLKDPLAVYRAHTHYTELLWNYLLNKFGEFQACKRFSQLLTVIFRCQSMTRRMRDFYRIQYIQDKTSGAMNSIAPLAETVLLIS
ncbi:hypothetical protein I4U23_022567 [Adineta vaga]|nr:hypothetical protein I4U23_022567 [Adineta vaga]